MSAPTQFADWNLWGPGDGRTEQEVAPVLRDPEGTLRAGTVLREVSGRLTAHVNLPDLGDVLVKWERETSFIDRFRRFARPPRARAEYDASKHLEAAGLPVPRSLLLAQRPIGWQAVETVYVAEWLPGRRTLAEALAAAEERAARALLTRVGALVKRMHAAGYDHRDLHGGNLLVGSGPHGRRPEGDSAGAEDLHLIDLHRGAVGGPPGEERVHAALARLLVSLRLDREDARARREALLAGYLDTLDPYPRAALEHALAPAVAGFRRHDVAKHDLYALEDGPHFVTERTLGHGVVRRHVDAEAVAQALAEHDRALAAQDARVLKDGRKSAVTRHALFVVKEARATGAWARFKRRLAPGRLAAGHVNAHRLEVRGIDTARSCAFLRRPDGRVFTVYEDLGRFPRLDHRAAALWRGGDRAHQIALRDASANWLADLHRSGVYHGDVKGVNVLVGGTPAAPRLYVVDTDRCRFLRRPVSPRRRWKNLAQLAASIERVVTRTERLRWWRTYAARAGLGDDLRTAAARVAALVARKLVVVDAPIE